MNPNDEHNTGVILTTGEEDQIPEAPHCGPPPSAFPLPPSANALSWVPELHTVVAEKGVFTLTHGDGSQRRFLNLALPAPTHAVIVFFDPSAEDEAQVFDAWKAKSTPRFPLDQKTPRGTALLLHVKHPNGHVTRALRPPEDLEPHAWRGMHELPDYLTVYFRDASHRLALGYTVWEQGVPNGVFIISGDATMKPQSWQPAAAVNPAMRRHLTGGAA